MSREEFELFEVTIKLPRVLVEFLQDLRINLNEYLRQSIIENFKADLNAMEGPLWDEVLRARPELERLMETDGE